MPNIITFIHQSRTAVAAAMLCAMLMPGLAGADTAAAKAEAAARPAAVQSAAKPAAHAQVNINTADAQTLADQLNGVGIKKAQAIVTYREQHGQFKSADELVNVAGIGAATLEKNRDVISVN